MPEISKETGVVTQITTVKFDPEHQSEALAIMTERARFMATQPGFVSISLHRGDDGSRLVNYVQWKDKESLTKAHRSREFQKKWSQFGEVTEEIEPCLYEVVHVESK